MPPEWAQCGWASEGAPTDVFGQIMAPQVENPDLCSWQLGAATAPLDQHCGDGAVAQEDDPRHAAGPENSVLRGRVWRLARHSQGCRDVQRALEEADEDGANRIADELRGHVWHAVECCNANHVLQKCIVCAPGAPEFIIAELLAWGPDGSKYLAKHRFGCRVFERLLVDQVLQDVVGLCTHQFANYVMQHLFEFG